MAEVPPEAEDIKPIIRGKGGKQLAMQNKNILSAGEIKFDFRKTARHETTDSFTTAIWDEFGRFFVIYGTKNPMAFVQDKLRHSSVHS